MATKLFLRNTTNNGIGNFYDMSTTAGSASTTGVVNTTASGTQIQWTRTAGGTVLEWISAPLSAGFTLSGTMSFSIWAHENNMSANIGARARVFKYSGGSESEVGGGPWDDGVEFTVTTPTEMTWTGTPTSTSFATGDRIIVRYYITNVGTMATGYTGTITYNAADAATGDSFFQINENVTFSTPQTLTQSSSFTNSNTLNYQAQVNLGLTQSSSYTNSNTLNYQHVVAQSQSLTQASSYTNDNTFYAHTLATITPLTASLYTNSPTYYTHTLTTQTNLTAELYSNTNTYYTHTLTPVYPLTASLYTNDPNFFSATLAHDNKELTASLYTNSNTFYTQTITSGPVTLTAALYTNTNTFYEHTIPSDGVYQSARFDNTNEFYAHNVSVEQYLTGSLYSNTAQFYVQEIRNQYPDPSTVLYGITYGQPPLELVGTYQPDMDKSAKIDLVSGKLVKPINNKVVLTL